MFVPSDDVFYTAYFQLDSKSVQNERKVYSLGDLMSQLGGMKEMLFMIGSLIVGFFQNKLYIGSLMNKLYLVHDEQNTPKAQNGTSQVQPVQVFNNEEVKSKRDEHVYSKHNHTMEKQVTIEEPLTFRRTNDVKESIKEKIKGFKHFKMKVIDMVYMNT